MKYRKTTEQAYQKIPNIVTEQIVIETKTSARLIPVTADKDSIDEINHAFAIAKKEHERLEKVEELLELKNSEIKLLKLRLFYHNNDEMDDDKFIENTLSLYETREKIAELEEQK
jgi:hypothetical protein